MRTEILEDPVDLQRICSRFAKGGSREFADMRTEILEDPVGLQRICSRFAKGGSRESADMRTGIHEDPVGLQRICSRFAKGGSAASGPTLGSTYQSLTRPVRNKKTAPENSPICALKYLRIL